MSIIILGDIVPTQDNYKEFCAGDCEKLVGGGCADILRKATFVVANLETPLVDEGTPIKKHGPNLMAPSATATGIKSLGIQLLSLANNHIMDQGRIGLVNTIKALNENALEYFGASCSDKPQNSYYVVNGEKTIGLYACAEHEFSIGSQGINGANAFEVKRTMVEIKKMRERCDYLILLYHGGKEKYRYPTPELKERCEYIIDAGADLVICQHSHCIGCKEDYRNGMILYGQGNFVFNLERDDYWGTSLMIEITDTMEIRFHPIVQTGVGTRLADDIEKSRILDGFESRSFNIKEPGFIEQRFMEYAYSNAGFYLNALYGRKSIVERVMCRLFGQKYILSRVKNRYQEKELLAIFNYIECEAHSEILIEGLKQRLKIHEVDKQFLK